MEIVSDYPVKENDNFRHIKKSVTPQNDTTNKRNVEKEDIKNA